MRFMVPAERLLRVAPCVALGLMLAAGCAERPPSAATATRVILPGEQALTPPAAGPAAQETAPPAAPGPSAAEAARAPTTEGVAAESRAAAAAAPAATTGSEFAAFTGRVSVTGTVPALRPLVAQGDPNVKDAVCVEQAIPDESVIVGPEGGLANVFVFARRLPAGVKPPPPPSEPVELDQRHCRFVPQAMVFRVGQPLLMKNSDPVAHNVRTSGFSMSINQIVSPNDQKGIAVKYTRPERMPVQTKCDIHAWMLAWHFPLDHPYAAVTGPDGRFTIPDLPAGDWEFVVWHGRAANIEKSYKFTAAAGQVITRDFSVTADRLSQ